MNQERNKQIMKRHLEINEGFHLLVNKNKLYNIFFYIKKIIYFSHWPIANLLLVSILIVLGEFKRVFVD